MIKVARFVDLVLAGLLAGNEFGTKVATTLRWYGVQSYNVGRQLRRHRGAGRDDVRGVLEHVE
jgi:hypothetical protein